VAVLYDEIDAHVGGRAAVALSRMLVEQSERTQVLAITHNPSLAASGDLHLVVRRRSDGRKPHGEEEEGMSDGALNGIPGMPSLLQPPSSFVSIAAVEGTDRRNELVRMASGDLAPAEAAAFAEALIRDGRSYAQGRKATEDPIGASATNGTAVRP
jgi:DNA repair ATPase RecN